MEPFCIWVSSALMVCLVVDFRVGVEKKRGEEKSKKNKTRS